MGEFQIKYDEINEKSPFQVGKFGRVIPQAVVYNPDFDSDSLPDYVGEQDWLTYIPDPEDGLTVLRRGEMYEGEYFGVESAGEGDIQIPFMTYYYQHASFSNIVEYFPSIGEDIRNMSASLSKFAIHQYLSQHSDFDVRPFIRTELEYLISVSRSMFDTIYMIARESWHTIKFFEGGQDKLPYRLTDLVLDDYDPIPSESLIEDYGLPEHLAEYFEELAEELTQIKYYRDSIHHYGRSLEIIFELDDGIAVDTSKKPYSDFDAWSDGQVNENDLGSIWPFIAQIIGSTMDILNNLFQAVFQDVALPPEIAPDYGVYLRGPHISNLLLIDSLAEEDQWGHSLVQRVESKMGV